MKMNKIFFQLFLTFSVISFYTFGQNLSSGQILADTTEVSKKPKSIHLVDINFELERTRKKISKISYELEPKPEFVIMDSLIVLQKAFFTKEVEGFRQFDPNNLSKYFLENTFRAWSGNISKLSNWRSDINSHISKIEKYLDELKFSQSVWKLTIEETKIDKDPKQLVDRISEIVDALEKLEVDFMLYRRKMIIRADNIGELMTVANNIQGEISLLQQHLRDNLFVADKPGLWNLKLNASDALPTTPRLRKAWHENSKIINYFNKEISYFYLAIIAVFLISLFILIIKKFRKLNLTEADPNFVIVKRVFYEHPYSSLSFLILVFFLVFLPNMPLIIMGILGTILLIISLFFLPKIIGPQGKMIVKVVLTLYIANLFEILIWYFGNYARLYIAFESALALFLIYKFILDGINTNTSSIHPSVKRFGKLSFGLFILFIVAFLSNLFGYLNLAVLTLKIGIKTAAIMVIIFSAHAILRSIVHALYEIGRESTFRLVANGWEKFEDIAIKLINVLAVVYLLKFILQTMEVYRPIINWLFDLISNEWQIGALSISIESVSNLVLILILTFGLAFLVKTILENKILAKTKLPKGVPMAISVTIQYFILVLGVLIAFSAGGIDLSKFGLLAGALGVGIGFGLQNIVNNFISGLILIYERPVNVGDTIEVENLMGTVRSVGVRASNVRTFDGAEVVVPNGNLISNQLINWTLSDNQRRIELKVGAAYGSNPNVILDLLKKVAISHESVLKNPEPRALFEEFGDSSLNFRLLFWVPFEKGIGVKSDVAIGVYNTFAENNVQIPFPQVDLHVKKDDEKAEIDKKQKPKEKSKEENQEDSGPIKEPELGGNAENKPEK